MYNAHIVIPMRAEPNYNCHLIDEDSDFYQSEDDDEDFINLKRPRYQIDDDDLDEHLEDCASWDIYPTRKLQRLY